ncbi:MAG TPA: hypothetical protein PK347_17850 [Burkholderiaceae bacterium]|nr:hypothetical protein [Burkholderiaceae bacterium]
MPTALSTLQQAGLSVSVTTAGKLAVTPASKLTPELRTVITLHRAELLQQLTDRAAANDPSATAGVCVPEIRTPEPLHCSSSDWHERDKAYQDHHVTCPACIAAGKGYGTRCDTGAELWAAYSETPKPPTARVQPAPATHPPTADIPPSLLSAATDAEIQRMAERLALFADRGVGVQDAEKLADRLLVRDREGDNRVACAECHRLVGNAPGRWRCGDRAPILQNDLAGANLGAAFVHQALHRCNSFAKVKP